MVRSVGFMYWAHAGKVSAGKVLRAVRLCLFSSCCFTHHAGAFVGRAPASMSRQAGLLHWDYHGSLTTGRVVDCQKQPGSSTYSRTCRPRRLRNDRARVHAADEEASPSGNTEVDVIPTAIICAAGAAAAAAAAAAAGGAEAEAEAPAPPTIAVKSTEPSFLAAAIKANRANRDGPPQVILYFAFGANMSPSVLTGKRGVTPIASAPAQALAFATEQRNQNSGRIEASFAGDEGDERRVCLAFSHRAGYATIAKGLGPPQSWEVSPGVHGVLHALSPSDMKRIEGFETGYRKRLVEVETSAGERDRAVCFVSNPSQVLPTSVPPTSRYLELLQAGASHHGVDEGYQSWLARLPSVPSKEAEASPERINTPSRVLVNMLLGVLAMIGTGAAVVRVGGGFVNGT